MDRRTLARQLSAIENGEMKVESYVDGDVIAITGPPGVGKSCIVDRSVSKNSRSFFNFDTIWLQRVKMFG